jgi:hypothetical protein
MAMDFEGIELCSNLAFSKIRMDGDAQMRAKLDEERIAEYAERIKAGDKFPPIVVFYDPTAGDYWPADGFHRIEAAKRAGLTYFPALKKPTTGKYAGMDARRAARWYAATEANHNHGLPYSNKDKQRAVDAVLQDPKGAQLSDREIARMCRVSHTLVSGRRAKLTGKLCQSGDTRRGGDGRVIKTGNIGRGRGAIKSQATPAPPAAPSDTESPAESGPAVAVVAKQDDLPAAPSSSLAPGDLTPETPVASGPPVGASAAGLTPPPALAEALERLRDFYFKSVAMHQELAEAAAAAERNPKKPAAKRPATEAFKAAATKIEWFLDRHLGTSWINR